MSKDIRTKDKAPSSLSSAPEDVQLAVDLIYLLESNDVKPEIALAALEIVKKDLESKIQ
ncbi:MAG: pleiotropic regulatory protein RsmS [Photobacterium frigidiphilum]|uniref:pleiotropic regulatory protein RsmS n=1 Tax=Photobacterium frigidiphilum TaxID=264736 RepID=UPI003002118B